MVDVVSQETRSRMMAGITGKDTRPEVQIRQGLHARGFRFRLHQKGLPGRPDLVFASRQSVIFVNGCFWHGHRCHLFKWPSTRREWWRDKINGTRRRDRSAIKELTEDGWRVLTIWECALKGKTRKPYESVIDQAARWLDGRKQVHEITGRKLK
ncbi:MAG: very short patch repair endonuclease [Pirellulaceae bacterium]